MTTQPLLPVPGPSFEDILQTGHVTRWHTKPMAVPQTLADHLAKVALLADRLGRHLPDQYDDQVAHETLLLALDHDLPETEHGDIPNPAKRWLCRELSARVGEEASYDDAVARDWWHDRGLGAPEPSPLAEALVRVADILEAATRYWTYGLDHGLRHKLVFEAFAGCRKHLPELLPVVAEALAAAGVPGALIEEAAA